MTLTAILPDTVPESIKEAVKSTTTCSPSTVSSLQILLRSGSSKIAADDGRPVSRQSRTSRPTTPSGTVSRPRSSRSVHARTVSKADLQDTTGGLSPQAKLVLATEVFNIASRTLSDAVQQRASSPKTPLQPTSPNRMVSSAKLKRLKEGLASGMDGSGDGVSSVAECARLALSCLRTLRNEKPSDGGYPNLQLEQGACILASRFVALDLHDMAFKELKGLKKRLEQHICQSAASRKPAAVADDDGKLTKADLLSFSHIHHAGPLLNIISQVQTNALKLILAEKKASMVDKASETLALSNPSSPANVIMAASRNNTLPKDKAAVQLLSLSNTISSLALLAQQSSNGVAPSKPQTKPATSLNLQLLALEIRTMSWELSGHNCDARREFWDPLVRSLETFANSGRRVDKNEFTAVYKTVQRLRSTTAGRAITGGLMAMPWKIPLALGRIAHDSGCLDEALKLYSSVLGSSTDNEPLCFSTVRCLIASLHLHRYRQSAKRAGASAAQSLSDAATGLKSSSKGSSADLEELLVESAKLRKLSMACLGESLTANCEASDLSGPIVGYLHAFIRFLRRYVGSQCPSADDPDNLDQIQQTLQRLKEIILMAAESAVAVGKASIMHQRPPWEEVQLIFTDCKKLLRTLETLKEDDANSESWQSPLVKLSNVVWSQYLKEREAGKEHAVLISLLEQSIALLQGLSEEEKVAGFPALKFERLAHLYAEARMGSKSLAMLERAIQEHVDSAEFMEFLTELSGRPPYAAQLDPQSPGFSLNRVLSTYLKMQVRRKQTDETSVFDVKDCPHRNVLLEWQMGLLAQTHRPDGDNGNFRTLFQHVISELLSSYKQQKHPLRRLRVILFVLRMALDHPDAIDSTVTDTLAKEAGEAITQDFDLALDTELAAYAPHLMNSMRLNLFFRNGSSDVQELSSIVSTWQSLLRNCREWEDVESVVDDPQHLIAQTKAVCDFLEARGLTKLYLSATELLVRLSELRAAEDASSVVVGLSRWATQCCRLGDCKTTISLLDRARYYIENHSVSCFALVTYQLSQAERFLEAGDWGNAEQSLSAAQQIYQSRPDPDTRTKSSEDKIAWERCVVDGTLLCSRLAFHRGSLKTALYLAKLSVRLSARIWAKLERLSSRRRDSENVKDQSEMDLVIDGVANVDLSSVATAMPTRSHAEGAVFWSHVSSHNACLLNLMELSAHNGLFQDTIYYGEQALKVNKQLGATARLVACQAALGLQWIRGDRVSEAKSALEEATGLSENLEESLERVALQTSLAALKKSQGKHDEALHLLANAEEMLGRLADGKLQCLDKPVEVGIEREMADLKIQSQTKRTQRTTTTRRTRSAASSSTSRPEKGPNASAEHVQSRSVLALKAGIIRQQVDSLLAMQEMDGALRRLAMARQVSLPIQNQLSLRIGEIEHVLADAMRRVTAHAVYCVLPESTLSVPSVDILQPVPSPVIETKRRTRSTTAKKSKVAIKEPQAHKGVDIDMSAVSKARSTIGETIQDVACFGSTVEGHSASMLSGRISMLQHATDPGKADDALVPTDSIELGRITAFKRERLAIDMDKMLAGYQDSTSWPEPNLTMTSKSPDLMDTFRQEYIDILPPDWNVLSVSLNSQRTEFVITKICRDRIPFMLRLPLKRANEGDDEEEEEFTFDAGKAEMMEIVKLANASAHDAKTRVDKKSRKEWWATREALDRRLEALLCNMENIWLGGFRGIFSPMRTDHTKLAQFAASFECILDKHLPSRRKSREKGDKIRLHEHVLELFAGLRDLDKQENPEDVLMDLLYFVVDILQFHGERNAYDEIDFDMMVVETLDALNAYHESVREDDQRPCHTILVLDKALHPFPWESLPCLQGLPVSRVPSLECLRERIVRFESTSRGSSGRFRISRSAGSYILNPSGDLKWTQNAFEADLAKAGPGWPSIVNRSPSEDEFKTLLEDRSMMLYFGHGSGAQYIRGRTIKRLERCAVTFLMGCSSGSLTEAGELEPFGPPVNYMHAGSPALVATLWDVTDKDIDRFARGTLERWGLLEGNEMGTAALDEAVAGSRTACVLRYLNGAAPVIYGIPVYLD